LDGNPGVFPSVKQLLLLQPYFNRLINIAEYMRVPFFLFLLIGTGLFSNKVIAQSPSPQAVLFEVAGKPVEVGEFDYIYRKTNGAQASYSRESLEEYLDLYIKFKLKVQRARDMQLDTITALSRELEDYRRQLADTYLVDKEVTDKLVEQAYQRMQVEREVAHILFKFKANANASDSAVVLDRANRVLEMVQKGSDFERMAVGQSDDQNARENKGNLGYLSAMLPNGFYDLENVIYETPVGKVSGFVYSPMGLHIIKVLNERPARGEIEVSHILIRDPENARVEGAEQRIIQLWTELKDGAAFDALANRQSEDLTTASKGGYLGFFGINRYEQSFEDAAFSLAEDGDISNPVRTRIGWHIIKRISKKGLEPLPKVKARMQAQIKQDGRFEQARRVMISSIQKEAMFEENRNVLDEYVATLDNEFLSYKWKGTEYPPTTIFKMDGKTGISTEDFTEFLLRNQRKRLQMSRDSNVVETAMQLYRDFVDESMIKYAEKKLEVKYPEFKALMREYEEGILLFEAAKMLIWDKASQDTIGLEAFHKANNQRYMWGERAEILDYRILGQDAKQAEKIKAYARKHNPAKVLKKFNKKGEVVNVVSRLVEKSNTRELENITWTSGFTTEMEWAEKEKVHSFSKVERLLAPAPKALNESRGPAIADYQDYLESQWVSELKSKYDVKVNEAVFKSLIRG
jgi:peptidyl-prolyl cis-trans isomerase SurA